jgi:hypothetical protein
VGASLRCWIWSVKAPKPCKGRDCSLNLLASNGANRGEIVVIKIVVVLVRVATRSGHGLRGQAVVAKEGRRRGSDLRVGTATARSGHTGIDARHAKAVRPRKGGGKSVPVAVLWWGGGLAVRRLLSVTKIGREAVDFLFAAARL